MNVNGWGKPSRRTKHPHYWVNERPLCLVKTTGTPSKYFKNVMETSKCSKCKKFYEAGQGHYLTGCTRDVYYALKQKPATYQQLANQFLGRHAASTVNRAVHRLKWKGFLQQSDYGVYELKAPSWFVESLPLVRE